MKPINKISHGCQLDGTKVPQRGRRSITRLGFSLLELLVVMGIVVVLLSVILPSITAARITFQTDQCVAQLRQWGPAMQSFAYNTNQHYVVTNYPLWPANGSLLSYLQNNTAMVTCPSMPPGSWTYGYTDWIGHWDYTGSEGDDAPYSYGIKWTTITHPDYTPLLSDAWNYRVTWPGEFEYPYFGPDFIHNGQNNTLFVDGHVESLYQSQYNSLRLTWVTKN